MVKKIIMQKDSKIIPFEQSGEFYYRKAQKYIDNNNYIDALSYYRKAVEKDPDNLEYLLDLAEIYTEMNYYEESNQILFYLIQSRNSNLTECYFGLGCNFMGLQEYDKAEECFGKYLQVDADGEFSEEAQDILDILQSQDFYIEELGREIDRNTTRVYDMARKGKDYLDKGEFKKAVRQLEKALLKDSTLIFAKNNLSLAYFCLNQIDKAIALSLEVIDVFPQNIHANCNLALFYQEAGDKEKANQYLRNILSFHPEDVEDLYKIAITLCETKYHKEANKLLKKLLQYKPYDKKILHYLAVSYFNMGMYREGLKYWNKIQKIDPLNTISSYYIHKTNRVIKNAEEIKEYPYHYQVPYDEVLKRIKKINSLFKMKTEDIKKKWIKDNQLKSLLVWGLELNDNVIKRAILGLISTLKDEKAERLLREFLLKRNETDGLKREVLAYLKQNHAKEPYIAYLNNSIVEVRVNIMNFEGEKIPLEYQKVIDVAIQKMHNRYPDEYVNDILWTWEGYVKSLKSHFPRIYRKEAWAAALEYYYCRAKGIHISKSFICKFYNTSITTLNNYIKKLEDALQKGENNEVN